MKTLVLYKELDLILVGAPTRMARVNGRALSVLKKLRKRGYGEKPVAIFDTYGPVPAAPEELEKSRKAAIAAKSVPASEPVPNTPPFSSGLQEEGQPSTLVSDDDSISPQVGAVTGHDRGDIRLLLHPSQ